MSEKEPSEYHSNIPNFSSSIKDQKVIDLITEKSTNFAGLEFEKLMCDIASNMVVSNSDELDSTIEDGLQDILDFLQLDIAVLFYQEKNKCLKLHHGKSEVGRALQRSWE